LAFGIVVPCIFICNNSLLMYDLFAIIFLLNIFIVYIYWNKWECICERLANVTLVER
jgi:hypothetical protein